MADTVGKVEPDYGPKYVAFLDVLGFSAQVQYADDNPQGREVIFSVIRTLRQTLAKWPLGQFVFTQFSDCIVLSGGHHVPGLRSLLWGASLLANNLLSRGVLLRGGITVGNIAHDDDTLFGPAMIRAYKMDRSGSPPRIGITDDVIATLKNVPQAEMLNQFVRQDEHDLTWMLHTLYEFENYDHSPGVGKVVLDGTASTVVQMIDTYADNLAYPPDVRAKWRWMRRYWNGSVSRRGILPRSGRSEVRED
jgi:hypothetical protein